MPQYKFIKVGTRTGKSKPTSSVRSHAIRAGLRKSADPSRTRGAVRFLVSTGPGGDPASPEIEAVEYGRSEIRANPLRPPTYHVEYVGVGRVDPFNCLPIPANPEIDHLVRYLITKYDLNSATADHSKSWFPYALQSASMMHSTLAMTAAVWRADYPVLERSIQIEGIRQKGEAMRLIRSRLAVADSVADGEEFTFVMSTMSTLVIVEILDGDFEAAETHLRGVQNLLSSRGGRDIFKDQWIFSKSTNVADIQVAVALGRQLIFPRLHGNQARLPASIINHAQDPPLNDIITDTYSHECAGIFTQLRQLILASQSPEVSTETQRALLNILDESILQYLYQDCAHETDSSRRSHVLVLAAHIFMYVVLHKVPPKSPLIARMCMRLQDIVGTNPITNQIWAENQAALIWIAFVGVLGTGELTEKCPEGQSFLRLLRPVPQEYPRNLRRGVGNLREILSTFLWDESHCQPLLAWLENHQLIGQERDI